VQQVALVGNHSLPTSRQSEDMKAQALRKILCPANEDGQEHDDIVQRTELGPRTDDLDSNKCIFVLLRRDIDETLCHFYSDRKTAYLLLG
jgi:hypothetical protein